VFSDEAIDFFDQNLSLWSDKVSKFQVPGDYVLGLTVSLVLQFFAIIVCLTSIAFRENIIAVLASLKRLAKKKKTL
jgi:hypothetical protein